jgi:hypothetical protein
MGPSDPLNALREQMVAWAALTITQGELLDAFAAYCEEVDELELLERTATLLRIAWRDRERCTVELTDDLPRREEPTLAVTELSEALVARLLDDAALRSRLAVYDLARLEKINAVRSSIFVYFEWFLRDVYGVKVLAESGFTRGLVERGIISLGMG